MSISKKTREEVYRKYNGHCAYCGREIEPREMQVDHFIPQEMEPLVVAGHFHGIDSIDDFQNLMPACRMCNHYKRAHSLTTFRRYIEEIPKKLRNDYIYKIGVAYGNIIENEKPIQFYFEQVEAQTCYTCRWGGEEDEEFGAAFVGHCWLHNGEVDFEQPDKSAGCPEWVRKVGCYAEIITKASPASRGIRERRENSDA